MDQAEKKGLIFLYHVRGQFRKMSSANKAREQWSKNEKAVICKALVLDHTSHAIMGMLKSIMNDSTRIWSAPRDADGAGAGEGGSRSTSRA
eukprot:5276068-Pyramimonas_sp.AAC.1